MSSLILGCWIWKWHIYIYTFSAGTFLNVNLHNMSAIQISVRLWQMLYQIEAITCGSSFICSCASFSGCHSNRSQEITKKTGEIIIIFIICVILKCSLSPINTSKDISMLIWLKYFGSEVQTCENDDNANAESIDNMTLSESFYQMSIRSCKIVIFHCRCQPWGLTHV